MQIFILPDVLYIYYITNHPQVLLEVEDQHNLNGRQQDMSRNIGDHPTFKKMKKNQMQHNLQNREFLPKFFGLTCERTEVGKFLVL